MENTEADVDGNCLSPRTKSVMTLNRFIMKEQRKHPEATGDLTQLLDSIVTVCKSISSAVRGAGMTKMFGVSIDGDDSTSENQKLHVLSNNVFTSLLSTSFTVCSMVSQENKDIIQVETGKRGKYIVYFDPLDGASNLDCLVSIGSIFGIATAPAGGNGPMKIEDVLLSGKNYVASGYALYGSATMLVLTTGQGVNGFTLDPSIGEFKLTDPDMKIKDFGKYYSVNEGYSNTFDKPLVEYLNKVKDPSNARGTYGARYIGSLVADMHRTIKYGGIFMYPATKSSPSGKLRLMYELNPMAHIVEQAGGLASTGNERILDVIPTGLHMRQPVFMGSSKDVQDYLDLVKKYKEENQETSISLE